MTAIDWDNENRKTCAEYAIRGLGMIWKSADPREKRMLQRLSRAAWALAAYCEKKSRGGAAHASMRGGT